MNSAKTPGRDVVIEKGDIGFVFTEGPCGTPNGFLISSMSRPAVCFRVQSPNRTRKSAIDRRRQWTDVHLQDV